MVRCRSFTDVSFIAHSRKIKPGVPQLTVQLQKENQERVEMHSNFPDNI